MGDYIIKRANVEDIKRIQELSQELIVYEKEKIDNKYMTSLDWALTKDGYENYKQNIEHDWIFVVIHNKKIIGYMTCWINKMQKWDQYKTLEVGNLYIQEAHRSNGLGTKLINIAKNLCKENNIQYLEVKVLCDNEKARNFYKRNGLNAYMLTQYAKID